MAAFLDSDEIQRRIFAGIFHDCAEFLHMPDLPTYGNHENAKLMIARDYFQENDAVPYAPDRWLGRRLTQSHRNKVSRNLKRLGEHGLVIRHVDDSERTIYIGLSEKGHEKVRSLTQGVGTP